MEEHNIISHNLGAHVHFIGAPPRQDGQYLPDIEQSGSLTLPADATASPFYITNAHNTIVGNAASGGWAAFAFPSLPKPLKGHRTVASFTPESRTLVSFEGNSAHSTGYWWYNSGAIYFGGKLWHPEETTDVLRYNPGRRRTTFTCPPPACSAQPSHSSQHRLNVNRQH